MRVLSLGWGVQSWTVACLAALGEIPPLDAAIHADTTHEREATYRFATEHTTWLEAHGVHVVTVRPEAAPATDRWGGVAIPAYTWDGTSQGQVKRQCTGDWKIAPIRRWLQANRQGQRVTLLQGISLDELGRMRDSNVRYIEHSYPLIDKRMTRVDCRTWLEHNGLDVPPRSACTFCPFQSRQEWQGLDADDLLAAIAVDEQIRDARPPGRLYVHPSMLPLAGVDLRSEQECGQLDLWESICDGHCGV